MTKQMNIFTPQAHKALALARKEAVRFHHNYVGTEHVLLGLIDLGDSMATRVLQMIVPDLAMVRSVIEKQMQAWTDPKPTGPIPYTPRMKKVINLAATEAGALNDLLIGTEHLLLGLLRESGGLAVQAMKSLNVDYKRCHSELLAELHEHQNHSTNA